MSIIKKIVALMLVCVMALGLVGCGDTTWIVKAGDIVINSGLYIFYQLQGYTEAVYTLSEKDMNYYYYYMYGYSRLDETIGDQKVSEYVTEYALDMCKQYVVVEQLFRDLGLELTADDKALIKAQVNSTWATSQEQFESVGIAKSTVEKALETAYKEDLVFAAYYEVGGVKGTTEETIRAYLEDEYARLKFMTFTFADSIEDAIDAERKEAQLALANSYLERAKAGEAMDDLIAEYNAYLETLDPETEEDSTTDEEASEAEDAENIEVEEDPYADEYIIAKNSAIPSQKFVNYVFTTCKVGEFTVIQDDTCFYLVDKMDILEREDILEESRDYLLTEIYDSDYTALINKTLSGYTIEINEKSVNRYTAENAIVGRDADK